VFASCAPVCHVYWMPACLPHAGLPRDPVEKMWWWGKARSSQSVMPCPTPDTRHLTCGSPPATGLATLCIYYYLLPVYCRSLICNNMFEKLPLAISHIKYDFSLPRENRGSSLQPFIQSNEINDIITVVGCQQHSKTPKPLRR
jgi:hypothetical protein